MRRPSLIQFGLILGAGLALAAGPAVAQSWSGDGGHRYYGGSNSAPSAFDWRSQLDRPGDYRCDAFWDANRTDCGERWRDQRHRAGQGPWNPGYGNGYGHGYRYGHGQGYGSYGHGYGGYGHGSGGTAYQGAYGRPDLVYPGGGYRSGYGSSYADRGSSYDGGRDPGRVDWCRASYRSYDPYSGYYRTYDGRLVFCG